MHLCPSAPAPQNVGIPSGPFSFVPLIGAPFCTLPYLYEHPMLSVLALTGTQVVYVESIARTRRFSLSAKLLYHLRMADVLFVQWEQLVRTYPRAVYAGRLY